MDFTMQCAKHGTIQTFAPMPGSSPVCHLCASEQSQREHVRHEAPFMILERLERIEALLHRVLREQAKP